MPGFPIRFALFPWQPLVGEGLNANMPPRWTPWEILASLEVLGQPLAVEAVAWASRLISWPLPTRPLASQPQPCLWALRLFSTFILCHTMGHFPVAGYYCPESGCFLSALLISWREGTLPSWCLSVELLRSPFSHFFHSSVTQVEQLRCPTSVIHSGVSILFLSSKPEVLGAGGSRHYLEGY